MLASIDVTSEFQGDSPRGPTESSLARVAALANQLVTLDRDIAEREALLKAMQEQRRLIAEDQLPSAMDSCGDTGLVSFTLGDGSKVQVKTKYRCGQLDDLPDDPKRPDRKPQADRALALSWLDQHGYGDLARRTIIITLGRASSEAEEAIRKHFESLRLNSAGYASANVVPWNTLSSLASKELASSEPAALEVLGVTPVRVAEVKTPKRDKDELHGE